MLRRWRQPLPSGTVRAAFCHPLEGYSHRKEGRQQTNLAGVSQNPPISAEFERTLQDRTQVWRSQTRAWVWTLPLCGQSALCGSILFHSHHAQPQTNGQSSDWGRFQDKDRFGRITKGDLSGLPERRQKGLRFRSILSCKSAKPVILAG